MRSICKKDLWPDLGKIIALKLCGYIWYIANTKDNHVPVPCSQLICTILTSLHKDAYLKAPALPTKTNPLTFLKQVPYFLE